MVFQRVVNYKWLLIACVILLGNIVVYQLSFVSALSDEQVQGMVIGSLIDCAVVAPALLLLQTGKWAVKNFVVFVAAGILFARLVIPNGLMEPFRYITFSAIAVEAGLVLMELIILFVFIKYLPSIIRAVKLEQEQLIFSFPRIVREKVKDNVLMRVLCQELLVFYYAFCSWKKKQPGGYSVHKNTMYIPMLFMIFHAALFEAIAFHWFFHDRIPVLAWGHTILSLYGLLFLLADFRALVLNPVRIENGNLYLSNGLLKQTKIDLKNISQLHTSIQDEEIYHFKVLGNTEEQPDFVLELKELQTIQLVGGFEKRAKFIGVYLDAPALLRSEIESAIIDK
ncbi:hypothetical protein MKY51_13645 [Solibacillus sp. FSL R5-0691]|uniref:hypothetical protein n=1 Tax=Solibacillus sp. FSL R5-0691 TaxID=2921653 RepID=UPI0030CEA1E5